ncbi:MAG TPA: winged helix-turn-helix domain-containing protein, partial [Candidatus Sulfotelmatobacter sp.]|nr:winged helix-turn-helix domain-containing protein [Candidatus Sulfotelmatobacter sp.]
LLRESWGLELESDSNLVDVYVNYLRKKIDSPYGEKLIHTVRGAGYRIGRPAPVQGGGYQAKTVSDLGKEEIHNHSAVLSSSSELAQQTLVRALIHALAHDLAQPLTSVRCFLEVMGMHQGAAPVQTSEIKAIEQQADRAISLAKGISALARELPVPQSPRTSLDVLLDDVFNDFIVLLHSGLLTLDRYWDASIQVTSSPMLRHLLVLFLSKLIGRNTRPLLLTVGARLADAGCLLELRWKANDDSQMPVLDAKNILSKDLVHATEMVRSIGGELLLTDGQPEILVKLPAAAQTLNGRQDLLN